MAKQSLPYTLGELRMAIAELEYLPDEVPVKIDGEGPEVFAVATESAKTFRPSGPPAVGITHVVIHGGRP